MGACPDRHDVVGVWLDDIVPSSLALSLEFVATRGARYPHPGADADLQVAKVDSEAEDFGNTYVMS